MVIPGSLVLTLPLIVFPQYIPVNKFAEAIPYSSYSQQLPPLKDTMHHNTMTTEELVRENNIKIMNQLYKTLE